MERNENVTFRNTVIAHVEDCSGFLGCGRRRMVTGTKHDGVNFEVHGVRQVRTELLVSRAQGFSLVPKPPAVYL